MRFKLKQQQITTHEKFHFSVQLTKKNMSLLTNKRSHTCKNWMQAGNQNWKSDSPSISMFYMYMPAHFAVVSTCKSKEPAIQNQEIWDTQHIYSVSTHTDCSSTFVVIMDPQLHAWYLSRTFQISDWKLVEDTTCIKLDSLWWLDAWVWPDSNESWTCGRCSGVWPTNCFGRSRCQLGCLPLGWSGLGSEIWDHSDYGKSNEAMNFCLEWSHPFIWSTMIQVISDHLSSSGSSQVNPLLIYMSREIS